ncbi:MAG: 3-phosphoshikimate 1-carboxyvinyltransferase [Bacteroidales bacterium]|nr:3-phosphoshikimate 1-carboxyvinyltransferase [Bacteroidales bacterium]
MKYLLLEHTGSIRGGSIALPGSKSISNRLLMMQILAENDFRIENLSSAADTCIMKQAFQDIRHGKLVIDAGEAGTAARFLTAYLAWLGQKHILTGSPRLQERPMAPLVEALRKLGARMNYLNKEGFLPIEFQGGKLHSASLKVPAGFSSQFFSALLMIAPLLPDGLTLVAEGEPVSLPYIEMTLELMRQGGVEISSKPKAWTVYPGKYIFPSIVKVEADWSAAAPWFVFSLWAAPASIVLNGLNPQSLQGDSKILQFFKIEGFNSTFTQEGLKIESTPKCSLPAEIKFDFTQTPDLALSLITAAAASGCKGTFSGLHNLALKESDRFQVLIDELRSLKLDVNPIGNHTLQIEGKSISKISQVIKTYNDHRIAMAFAPLVLLTGKICIENPGVVSKSYPDFWKHLADRGIRTSFYNEIPAF